MTRTALTVALNNYYRLKTCKNRPS